MKNQNEHTIFLVSDCEACAVRRDAEMTKAPKERAEIGYDPHVPVYPFGFGGFALCGPHMMSFTERVSDQLPAWLESLKTPLTIAVKSVTCIECQSEAKRAARKHGSDFAPMLAGNAPALPRGPDDPSLVCEHHVILALPDPTDPESWYDHPVGAYLHLDREDPDHVARGEALLSAVKVAVRQHYRSFEETGTFHPGWSHKTAIPVEMVPWYEEGEAYIRRFRLPRAALPGPRPAGWTPMAPWRPEMGAMPPASGTTSRDDSV